ncbi:MAG: hypothetical protein U0V72_08190 [Cytophagales bacterium]
MKILDKPRIIKSEMCLCSQNISYTLYGYLSESYSKLQKFSNIYCKGNFDEKFEIKISDNFIVLPISVGISANGISIEPETCGFFSGFQQLVNFENLHENTISNFLLIEHTFKNIQSEITEINFIDFNSFATVIDSEELKIEVGVFEGRVNHEIIDSNTNSKNLFFVINGAFELQNILLEHQDMLILHNEHKIEFESLAQHSTLLSITLK